MARQKRIELMNDCVPKAETQMITAASGICLSVSQPEGIVDRQLPNNNFFNV